MSNKMYKYDTKKDEWKDTSHQMIETRGLHSCLVLNNEIFVAGGYQQKTTEIFDLQSHSWRTGPDLPKAIFNSQFVMAKQSSQYAAYLIGGRYGTLGPTDNCTTISDIYGLTKDSKNFEKIGDLNTARYAHAVMVLTKEEIEKCID